MASNTCKKNIEPIKDADEINVFCRSMERTTEIFENFAESRPHSEKPWRREDLLSLTSYSKKELALWSSYGIIQFHIHIGTNAKIESLKVDSEACDQKFSCILKFEKADEKLMKSWSHLILFQSINICRAERWDNS